MIKINLARIQELAQKPTMYSPKEEPEFPELLPDLEEVIRLYGIVED